jgi:hypothetical protein
MKWVLGLLVVLLVLLALRRSQRKAQGAAPDSSRAPDPSRNRRLQELKSVEGAICIYEEGALVAKGRLLQIREMGTDVVFVVQGLRSQGLPDLPDERLNLEVSWTHLDFSGQLVHSHRTHWRLYFDRGLIEQVTQLGLSAADIKTIKRVLLEHQMK